MNQHHASWGSRLALASLLGALLGSCQDRDVTVDLRSLNQSGDVSYVCTDAATDNGVPLSECTHSAVEGQTRNLIALVTQTATGEVALVNVPTEPRDPREDEGVIDVDPSTPGSSFLRVGAHPEDIVSTPNGVASFVSSADAEKPGIFALPTTCLGPPGVAQTQRDLTTWSACSLPTPPGKMELVFDREGPSACGLTSQPEGDMLSRGGECPASLVDESSPGRWKLVVALPETGSIAIIDAQALLNRKPGTFDLCPIDRTYALTVDLPAGAVEQRVPDELQACVPSPIPTRPPPPALTPRPSDLALAGGVLYASDDQAPVIHRLDVTQPCAAAEMPPLLPVSFDNPARTVTTTSLAVSPLTPSNKRFVYAVDRFDSPMSSMMVFDVSPGSTERTPIIRPGSADIPGDSPDRLRFTAPIRDVVFIERDLPRGTGVTLVGQACNPSPDPEAEGTEYQPYNDISDDDSTAQLRGVFAMALLSNGQMSVIDVEDFDAPCRRPKTTNPSSEFDFHGCANDPVEPASYVKDNVPTVTDEVSCRMVEPHRQRGRYYGLINDTGTHAPSLQSFPKLELPDTELGRTIDQRPKLLAVEYPGPDGMPQPAQVYVSGTRHASDSSSTATKLDINPQSAEQNSLSLPFVEPRAYTGEAWLLRYEGQVTSTLTSGIFQVDAETGGLTLHDPGVSYCDAGVNDVDLMRELGERRFALSGRELNAFAEAHADAVWVTDDFPDDDDAYWGFGPGCHRAQCEETFGEFDDEELNGQRRFGIVEATADLLTLQGATPELTKCCFPAGFRYEVRATKQWVLRGDTSGVPHDVVAYPTDEFRPTGERVFDCRRDCNPRKRWDDSRIFEIATSDTDPENESAIDTAVAGDPCVIVIDTEKGEKVRAVTLDEPAARCIYSTPTARFAVYRGNLASARNMAFSWSIFGTFEPLGVDFNAISSTVSPASLAFLPDMDWLTIVDSASLGLVVVDLDELTTLTPTIN